MRTYALLIVSLAGSLSNGAQSAPRELPNPPFTITIAPVNTQVKAGTQVDVKLRLTNTSRREMGPRGVFIVQGLDMAFHYDCKDASGKSVAKEIFAIGNVGDMPALGPGESRNETATISNACDLSRPGKYEIQISRSILDDPQRRVIKSNTISITITY